MHDEALLQVLHENPSLLSRELKEAHRAKLKTSRSDVSEVDTDERESNDIINSHNSLPVSSSSSNEQATLTGANLADNEVIVNKALLDALTTLTSSLRSNTSASTVVMSDKNLPNTHLTMPLTTVKVESYIDAVKKLLNSSFSFEENRNAFDNIVEANLDIYWDAFNKVEGLYWKDISLNQFKSFLMSITSKEPRAFIDESVGLQVKILIQKGLTFKANAVSNFVNQVARIKAAWDLVPDADKSSDSGKAAQRDLCDQLKKNVFVVVDGENSSEAYNQFWNNVKSYKSTTFSETLAAVGKVALQIGDAINLANVFLINKKRNKPASESRKHDTQPANKKPRVDKHPSGSKKSENKSQGSFKLDSKGLCYGCGNNHGNKPCFLFDKSHSNKEDLPWAESKQGKYFRNLGYTNCPQDSNPPKRELRSKSNGSQNRGENDEIDCLLALLASKNSQDFINMSLLLPQGKQETILVLLDSGATTSNYLGEHVASKLVKEGINYVDSSNTLVCTGLDNMCDRCKGRIEFELITKDERDNFINLKLSAKVIISPYDLIIGRPSIKQHKLVKKFPSHFMDSEDIVEEMLGIVEDDHEKTLLIQAKNEAARTTLVHERIAHLNTLMEKPNKYKTNAAIKSAFEREDIEEIPLDKLEAVPSDMISEEKGNNQLPTAIFGPDTLQAKLKQTCELYQDCFSTEVKEEPAKVPPYELRIDESKWEVPSHRLPPRRMDKTRQTELVRQVKVLQDSNILRVSSAAYYSHPLMVPKPNNKWRFCVDYTGLNKLTRWEKWPLPNIQEMLRRIGEKKPKYFIILDLTSGYHQIPIAENCRRWTAFLTFWGIFEWLRMPMGLAGAASYFQKIMTTIVLAGLIMIICEIYLDDLIIPATTEEELIHNFIIVLERFRKYGITINPLKCLLGISEAVYVGHTINEHGLHFKREKLDSVLNFPKPIFSKQLKSFVSLASYFRNHVRNHATRVQPLFELLKDYERNKRIVWTEASEAAFDDIREAIHQCPRLFFMDDISPIILYTDASDYGVGAYLCQLVDAVEIPIAFISCSLVARMRSWATPVKEGYAIFYALTKLEYLLRDRHFVIKTDHKNLTILKEKYGTQDKVQRWFKCYQGFDFDIEDVKGVDNPIADSFSRLCPVDTPDETERLCLLEDDDLYVPRKEWAIIAKFHNNHAGHHGVDRTVSKLQSKGHNWSLMRAHVRRFKKMCPCCQKMDHIGPPIRAHKFTLSASAPMDEISIDFIENLLPDDSKNNMLLVIIDSFSRFVELFPAKDNTAKTAALAILQHIGRYGAPYRIRCDRGAAFTSRLVKEVTELIGVELAHTMAYSKEENSIVERANKEIERHLRNIIFDKDVLPKWSTYIPLVQRIMNSCVHRTTGVTPAEIIFSNAIDLDRGIFLEHLPQGNPKTKLSKWMADMRKAQANIIAIAKKNLKKHDEVHMLTQPINPTTFPINSYVLVEHRHNSLRKGPKSKLLPYRKGPMRVVNSHGSKYVLQDLVTKRNKDYHVKRLVSFNFDPEVHDPLKFALKDETNMFEIEKITHIRGNPNGLKSQLQFKVHWKNDPKTTMEPWRVVRNTIALQTFLSNHKKEAVRNLLPNNVELEQEDETDSDSDLHSDDDS